MLAKFLNLPAFPFGRTPADRTELRRPELSCGIYSKYRQFRRCHRLGPPLML